MKVILASSSPRRKQLMDLGNFDYEILTGDVDETRNETLSIEEQSKDLALRKAKFVYDNTQGDRAIIAADTLVVRDNKIYGKAEDKHEAVKILRDLQGKRHFIYR